MIDQETLKIEALSANLFRGSILRAFEHRGTIYVLYSERTKEKSGNHFFILDLEKQALVDTGLQHDEQYTGPLCIREDKLYFFDGFNNTGIYGIEWDLTQGKISWRFACAY